MRGHGLDVIAWSPLAKGALAGLREAKTIAQKFDPVFRRVSKDTGLISTIKEIAGKYNVSPATISLAWIIRKNAIPIPGTRRVERVREYSLAAEIELSDEDMHVLDRVSDKYRSIWGRDYSSINEMRIIPSFLQALSILLSGGI
jgi:diketogulonate reductase-like aldo/keto reductase